MKHSHDALAGTLVIALLVTTGLWYAQDPECQNWPLSCFSTGPTESGISWVTINRIEWSADGQRLLSLCHGKVNSEGQLALHDLEPEGASVPIDAIDDLVATAALAPDGRHVLIGSNHGHLWWIDIDSTESSTPLVELTDSKHPFFSAVAIAPDGRLIAGSAEAGTVHVCDPRRRSSVKLTAREPGSFRALRFARDGQRLIGSQTNGRIVLWNVVTGDVLQELAGHPGPTLTAEFPYDNKRIISAGLDDTVRIWDIATGDELWRGEFGLCGINALTVSPDGSTAAWGGFSRRIIVWDLDRQQKKFEIISPATRIYDLAFSPDGTSLAAGGSEEFIRLYDVQTGAETKRIEVASPESL
ncbi:MAG: WD40 repeat domain-containing protein [Deltaproteobacteria bacterium]